MRFFRRALVGLFLVAVTLGLLAMAAQTIRGAIEVKLADARPAMPARERVFSANLLAVEPATITPVMTAFGEIRARRSLELRSPRAGTVAYLADGFEDGAQVTAGQLLLRLDPADATAGRDLAQSDMARAEAEAREADRALILAQDDLVVAQAQADLRAQALARQKDLRNRGAGSDAAVETAALAASAAEQSVLSRRSALAQAEARIDQAATALSRQSIMLAEAERALRETELFAEFDGVLSGVSVVAGRRLGANESLGALIDPSALEVAFRLSTAQYARLVDDKGTLIPAALSIVLEVSGAEIMASGQLARVGATVGDGQTGRQVYAGLAGAGGFRPGDFVTVRIEEPALQDVVLLPATAVGAAGTVLVLGEGDRLVEIPVTLLRRQDDRVIVSAGPIVGREVVSERSPLLGAGIRVKPVRAQGPGASLQDSRLPDSSLPTSGLQSADPQTAAPLTLTRPEMVDLSAEKRAELIALVEGNARLPADAKARLLAQLAQDQVPAQVIERLQRRRVGG